VPTKFFSNSPPLYLLLFFPFLSYINLDLTMEDIDTSPAFQRLQNKPDTPTIDFSVHTMEDGSVVSTKERVIKGIYKGKRMNFRCRPP
jgi:hypothetical protein